MQALSDTRSQREKPATRSNMSPAPVANSEHMASKAKPKKRAREDDARPRKKRKGGSEHDESLLDTELGLNVGIALMDPQLTADHLAQKTTRFGSDLSPVELADLYISRKSVPSALERTRPRLTDWRQPTRFKIPPRGKSPELWPIYQASWRSSPRPPRV